MNSKSQYNNCPLCESIQLIDKWSVSGFTIAKCSDCSVLFVRDQLTKHFIKDFYDDLEANAVYADGNIEFLNYYYQKLIDEINVIRNSPDPPPLNWSTRYDSSGRTDNEYQTT
jgi:hypothetical protein